jgi:N-acetylglutamate synthase-like GNAT family acetyltransferase
VREKTSSLIIPEIFISVTIDRKKGDILFIKKEACMEEDKRSGAPGVYGLAAKTPKIRQATESDMGFIKDALIGNRIDVGDLDHNDFVVADEDGDITGFGSLRKIGGFYQIGCVVVVEEKRGRGIGSLIVNHLLDFAQVDVVYVLTDLADYFKKLGFVEMKEGSKEVLDALDEACNVRGKPNMMLMVYEKPKI